MLDLGLLRGVITLVTLLTFIGICWWAYRPENRTRFEEDGMLAFGDEEPPSADVSAEYETDHSADHSTDRSNEGSQA